MDRPSTQPGSVRRARERAEIATIRNGPPLPEMQVVTESNSDRHAVSRRLPQPAPATVLSKTLKKTQPTLDGKVTQTISKPRQVPQWPLPGPTMLPTSPEDTEPYRLPYGQPREPPQRPRRPSRIPSMVDQSRLQEPTPSFRALPSVSNEPSQTVTFFNSSPPAYLSPEQGSPLGPIPDFPAPVTTNTNTSGQPRRVFIGPPPTSRRGQSSYYSTLSVVSPIAEESPRSRSRTSYASSAAMPENWRAGSTSSVGFVPSYSQVFYEESVTDKSRDSAVDDYGDESTLVPGATNGNRASLAYVPPSQAAETKLEARRNVAVTDQAIEILGYADLSTNLSNTLLTSKSSPTTTPGTTSSTGSTPKTMLRAYPAAGFPNTIESHRANGSPQQHSRLSAIRRPPRLDMDAVKAAEARGSLTSLPDLIRRATTLAAMIDKGRRPASRFDDLGQSFGDKGIGSDGDRQFSSMFWFLSHDSL